MKFTIAALILSLATAGTAAFAVQGDATVTIAKGLKVADPAKAAAKAEKKASKQLEKQASKASTHPLLAQVVKVDAGSITVKTLPLMGPDGLIPAKEKTYSATDTTTAVVIKGENKKLSDLTPGAAVRIEISADGKTLQHVETKGSGGKKAAAKPSAVQ